MQFLILATLPYHQDDPTLNKKPPMSDTSSSSTTTICTQPFSIKILLLLMRKIQQSEKLSISSFYSPNCDAIKGTTPRDIINIRRRYRSEPVKQFALSKGKSCQKW